MTIDPRQPRCRCGALLARDNSSGICGACATRARDAYLEPPMLPRSFWETDEMREALALRHMGKVIRAYRTHPYHGKPLAQPIVAGWMGVDQTQLSRIETRPALQDLGKLIQWAYTLRIPEDLLWFALPQRPKDKIPDERPCTTEPQGTVLVPLKDNGERGAVPYTAHTWTGASDEHSIEVLRHALTTTLTAGAMTDASLDDWELIVQRYGHAARNQPASTLLTDLAADLSQLNHDLSQYRSPTTLRQLTRLIAYMSGLMCLALIKLDQRTAFRDWARTARIAADESGDPNAQSWVLAQEAYGHFYSGDLSEATYVAHHAQDITGARSSIGSVLAAALEARAHATLKRPRETRTALLHAETVLEQLNADSINTSAFGYNEAQLRFHEGNALTHLGDTKPAQKAQERALQLCPVTDYMDRTLTRLDRAACFAHDGDATGALEYATKSLLQLNDRQREGIISTRAYEIVTSLPQREQVLPAARELRELLAETNKE
jgi:tetratricopeptide (TPR) repeat protein